MPKKTELNSCRECGLTPDTLKMQSEIYPRYTVFCDRCGIGVIDKNELDYAIKNWNRMNA